MSTVPKIASYAQHRLDRRDFFKLAAVAGVAAAWGGQAFAQSPGATPGPQPAYRAVAPGAQYGRARGRYPVARS